MILYKTRLGLPLEGPYRRHLLVVLHLGGLPLGLLAPGAPEEADAEVANAEVAIVEEVNAEEADAEVAIVEVAVLEVWARALFVAKVWPWALYGY